MNCKKFGNSVHFEGEQQNLDIHPKLLEIPVKHPRMLTVGNVKEKSLSTVSSISWHLLDQQYPKNACGISVIPLLFPQIPSSANMWENVKLNTVPNLKKSFILGSFVLQGRAQVKWYFPWSVLFLFAYDFSMTFVTIPMLFVLPELLALIFCTIGINTLCFLNSFSNKDVIWNKATFLMQVVTYGWWCPSGSYPCLKPNNCKDLCGSKVQ